VVAQCKRVTPSFHTVLEVQQALNNSETLKLLASVELACYRCGLALSNPALHGKVRRRIEKLVKEDRRRRHKRRRDDDELVTAFDRQAIA
jgi:hypothetical protein